MGRGKEIGLDTRDVGSNDEGVLQYLACTIKPRDLAFGYREPCRNPSHQPPEVGYTDAFQSPNVLWWRTCI